MIDRFLTSSNKVPDEAMLCEWRQLLINRGIYVGMDRSRPIAEGIIDLSYRQYNINNSDRVKFQSSEEAGDEQHFDT